MNFMRGVVVALVIIVGLNLVGCCTSSKKETEKVIVPAQSTTPTLGKELTDLEDAYKKGAITKEEYETAKKKMIEQGTQPSK